MSEHVYKLVELAGSSDQSIQHAIEVAITRAAATTRNLRWFEVLQTRGQIADGKIERYQVLLKAGFTLEDPAAR
jgi:flavin-binding protein dodecin